MKKSNNNKYKFYKNMVITNFCNFCLIQGLDVVAGQEVCRVVSDERNESQNNKESVNTLKGFVKGDECN